MTQINTTPITLCKPDSVLFGELAIAAALAGKPVAVCFTESAAAVDCELWAYFSRLVVSSHVLHIHNGSDIRKLTKTFDQWRLVIVHLHRLYNMVTWTVRSHNSESFARPAITSRFMPESIDDVPIPLLVLRNTPDASSAIVRWLMAGYPQGTTLESGQLSNGIGLATLGDCKLLSALLCGVCLIRTSQHSGQDVNLPTCGQVEYEQVRWLTSPSTAQTSLCSPSSHEQCTRSIAE